MADNKVLFYEGRWYMFSNFSSFAILLEDGYVWPTVEHAYQAAKFHDENIRMKILKTLSAHDAKKTARRHSDKVRADWCESKLAIMEHLLRAKLMQHSHIMKMLLKTGGLEIVEDSHKDAFWGRGPDWEGENNLGKLWMKLREELQSTLPTQKV